MFRSNTDFENEVFKDLEFIEVTYSNIQFENCIFNSCNFSSSTFLECEFNNCVFDKCNLSNIKLRNSRLRDCKFSNSKMMGIDFTLLDNKFGLTLNCDTCDLSFTNYMGLEIPKSKMINCNLSETDFAGTICKDCNFEKSNLLKAIFTNTDLRNSNLKYCINYVIDLTSNKVKGAVFSRDQVTNLLQPFSIKIED